MFGEQWICLCGWHNFFLRKTCRNCGKDKEALEKELGREVPVEYPLDVIDNITQKQLEKN